MINLIVWTILIYAFLIFIIHYYMFIASLLLRYIIVTTMIYPRCIQPYIHPLPHSQVTINYAIFKPTFIYTSKNHLPCTKIEEYMQCMKIIIIINHIKYKNWIENSDVPFHNFRNSSWEYTPHSPDQLYKFHHGKG